MLMIMWRSAWVQALILLVVVVSLTWAYHYDKADLWAVLLAYTLLGMELQRGLQYLLLRGVLHWPLGIHEGCVNGARGEERPH